MSRSRNTSGADRLSPLQAARDEREMSAPLTVRNLTAQPLTLKLVERYEAPEPQSSSYNSTFSVSSLKSNLSSLVGGSARPSTSAAPSSAQLSSAAQSFAREDVDIRTLPFSTHPTSIPTTQRRPNETLRLTLHGDDGSKWRIDVPTPSAASQALTPLTPRPRHAYTALFFADSSFLALLDSSTPLHSWMRAVPDATPLSALSIPGTHNSPTCHRALPSVRCQAAAPAAQLRNGVRFFDVRLHVDRPADARADGLTLVHGAFPVALTGARKFRGLLADLLAFLAAHPSETVLVSLKREGTGAATDEQLATLLHDHYIASSSSTVGGSSSSSNASRWFAEPRIPTLGEARGKLVLVRRFALPAALRAQHDGAGWGLDAEAWDYNSAHCAHGAVCVQDFCEVLEPTGIARKLGFVCAHFERAGAAVGPVPGVTTDAAHPVPPGPLFLNFLSASNFWRVGCWPDRIAARLNPAVTRFLCEEHCVGEGGKDGHPREVFGGDGGVGVVVCDWVGKDGDWDLVRCIVGMNGRLLLRERERGA